MFSPALPSQKSQIETHCYQHNATIRPQENAGGYRQARARPGFPREEPLIQTIQTGDGAIQRHYCKENFQGFGEDSRCVVRQKRTKRRQLKGDSRSLIRNSPSCEVSDDNARAQIHQDLRQHHRPKVSRSEQREDCREKTGITRQTGIRRHDFARLRERVDSML